MVATYLLGTMFLRMVVYYVATPMENLGCTNAKTFRDIAMCTNDVIRVVISDQLHKVEQKLHAELWRDYFSSCLS